MIDARVNGKTAIFGVIGDPVSHSFSPVIHNTIAARLGDDLIYGAARVLPESLGAAIQGAHALGVAGINVTIPHKTTIIPFLTRVETVALAAGAVNTLKYTTDGYEGYNTDITGILDTLRHNGAEIAGSRGLVLGAGGTARAAVVALCAGGAARIGIINRTPQKAVALAEGVRNHYDVPVEVYSLEEARAAGHWDMLIQTTSAGFGWQAGLSPIGDKGFFRGTDMVLDVIYTPWETALMRDAREMGARCVNGFELLIRQAVKSYRIWQGHAFDEGFVQEIMDELAAYYRAN